MNSVWAFILASLQNNGAFLDKELVDKHFVIIVWTVKPDTRVEDKGLVPECGRSVPPILHVPKSNNFCIIISPPSFTDICTPGVTGHFENGHLNWHSKANVPGDFINLMACTVMLALNRDTMCIPILRVYLTA